MTKKNKSKRNKELDYFPSLYMMLDDYPVNKYDGFSMPSLQMNFNSGSFWSNPSLGQNLSLNSTLGLGLNSIYNLGLNNTPKLFMPSSSSNSSGNGLIGNSSLAPVYGAAAGMGFDAVDSFLAGGKSSALGTGAVNAGASLMTAGLSSGNPALMLAGGIAGTAGTIYNTMFGSKMNYENINRIEKELDLARNYNSSATNFDELTLEIMNAPSLSYFSKSDIGSDGLFSNKASRKFRELSARKKFVEDWINGSLANTATNLQLNQLNDLLMGWFAYGGPLDNSFGSGAIDYDLANQQLGIDAIKAIGLNRQYSLPNLGLNTFAEGGGIHIALSKKGTFTAAAKKHGKGVQEFASLVLANKENYSPAMVKKANFARNSTKFKHAFGGDLLSSPIYTQSYNLGEVYDVDDSELELLKKLGYEYEIVE